MKARECVQVQKKHWEELHKFLRTFGKIKEEEEEE